MEIYTVGGAVRDKLLGLDPKDVDYVVVGASEDEMLQLGYSKVGADFPVFLHPVTNDEYALARTERKTKRGYHGFEVNASKDVTLADDLLRRDLTINAMAMNDAGEVFDPHGGLNDLNNRVLRHTSLAFMEDPVRVLRIARFAARYSTFTVADETIELIRSMVKAGELDALVPERVWAEFAKGLMENRPWRMIDLLHKTGALEVVAPRIHQAVEYVGYLDRQLNAVIDAGLGLNARFAAIAGQFTDDDYEKLKVPTDVAKVSSGLNKFGMALAGAMWRNPEEIVEAFQGLDILRNPKRFDEVVNVIIAIECGVYGNPINRMNLLTLAMAYDIQNAGEIAQACKNPKDIKSAVLNARTTAVVTAWELIRSNK